MVVSICGDPETKMSDREWKCPFIDKEHFTHASLHGDIC